MLRRAHFKFTWYSLYTSLLFSSIQLVLTALTYGRNDISFLLGLEGINVKISVDGGPKTRSIDSIATRSIIMQSQRLFDRYGSVQIPQRLWEGPNEIQCL